MRQVPDPPIRLSRSVPKPAERRSSLNDLSLVCNWIDEQLEHGADMPEETRAAFDRVVKRHHEAIITVI